MNLLRRVRAVHLRLLAIGAAAIAWPLAIAHGQKPVAASAKLELPQNPGQWIQGRPISLDNLKGKGIFLWFFEQRCPRCREKWTELLAAAAKHEGEPVLFIAVSSGNTRASLETYARETGVRWPILVDTSREFETLCGVPPVSLQNVMQCKIITPQGAIASGDWGNVEGSIAKALNGAAWKIDPKATPANIKPLWEAVEFGNYAAAGGMLKKSLTTGPADSRQAAEKIKAVVQSELEALLQLAKTAEDKGNSWIAYKKYGEVGARFAGFDVPASVEASRKKLAESSDVKANLSAQKDLDAAKKLLSTPNSVNLKKATLLLEKLSKDSSNTDAGQEADALLKQANAK